MENIRVSMILKNVELGNLNGAMALNILENGTTINVME